MACFLIPMTEAIVTTVAQKVLEQKEKKTGVKTVKSDEGYELETTPFSKKLGCNSVLGGGESWRKFPSRGTLFTE